MDSACWFLPPSVSAALRHRIRLRASPWRGASGWIGVTSPYSSVVIASACTTGRRPIQHFVRASRDYRLLFPQSSYWYVDEYPGKGYFFLVASPVPFDFSQFEYARYDRGWDLTLVGRSVYEDPYLAIDDYVATLIPDWEVVPYGLDFTSYDVGEQHDYPRFLCYDCHGFRSYVAWNPYTYVCATYRVVIWDDPYFYPTYRYSGTRVVYAQPRRGVARFEFKERAVGEPWSPLVRTRQAPLRRPAQYVEPSVATPRTEYVPPRQPRVPSQSLQRGTSNPASRPGAATRSPTRSGGSSAVGGSRVRQPSPATPTRATSPGTVRRPSSTTPRATTSPPRTNQRPVLQKRPSSSTRSSGSARPSSGARRPTATTPPRSGTRTVVPSRPSTSRPSSARPRPSTSRPSSARPSSARPSSGSRPAVRSKPPVKKSSRPPPRRKPGG